MAIEVIVVGLGQRGRDWIREVRATPEFELVACVDSDREVLNNARESLNLPSARCYEDLTDALDKTACDAVIVATSADQHVAPCETALSRKVSGLNWQTIVAIASASLGTMSPAALRFALRSVIRARDGVASLRVKDGRPYEWRLK